MSDEIFKFTPEERAEARAKVHAFDGAPPPYKVEDLQAPGGPPEPYRAIPYAAPPRELLEGPATLPAGVSYYFPPNFSGLTCHRFIASRFTKAIGRMSLNNQRFVFHFE